MKDYSVFRRYFSDKQLSHAYILSGASEGERDALAYDIAAALVCDGVSKPCGACSHCRKAEEHIHPDIIVIGPEKDKSEIYIKQIRDMRTDAVVMPNEAHRKVYIIHKSELMNPSAQNGLLKLLEEPPSHCAFVLCTENSGTLLQTVRSRCVEVRLSDSGEVREKDERAEELLNVFINESGERLLTACFELDKLNRNEFFQLLDNVRLGAMARLRAANRNELVKLKEIIEILDRVQIYSTYNVGVGHTVGLILASLV